jgi:hypothetical protein
MTETVAIRITLDTRGIGAGVAQARKTLDTFGTTVAQHQRKIEAMQQRHSNTLEAIERRRLAQIDVIRERALVQEQNRLKRLETSARQSASNISRAFGAIGGLLPGVGVAAFGGAAISKALDADKLKTQLTSMLGSVEKANAKILEFRAIAKSTPGVIASDLATSFAQLRSIAGLTDSTATKFALAVSRIKALFPAVEDVRNLAVNLQQIYSGNFELSDVKQLNQVAPGLFKSVQDRLGAANLETLRKMKEQGKLSAEQYASGFIDELTARSGSISETLQLRMAKALEETNVKIAELGDRLLRDFLPVLDKMLPPLNAVLDVFGKLPTGVQAATFGFVALAPALTPAINAVRSLSTAFLGLSTAMQGALGIVGLGLIGGTVAYNGLRDLLDNQIPANVRSQLGLQDRSLLNPSTDVGDPRLLNPGGYSVLNGKIVQNKVAPSPSTRAILDLAKKAGSKSSRARTVVNDYGLGDAEKLAHEAELARIRLANEAVAARRAQGAQADASAIEDRKGRLSRAALTQDLDYREEQAKAIEKQREALTKLEPVLSNTQRFMQGLRGETDQLGNAFERFGDSVGRAFGDVRNLFSGLRDAIKSFFADITGGVLRNVAGSVLGPLLGRVPQFGTAGGGFFTGGFAGGPGAGSYFQQSAIQQIFSSGAGGSVGGGWVSSNVPTRAGRVGFFPGIIGSLKSAFSGAGGPLFGAGIGSMFGGQSVAGNILGSAGGALATGFVTSSLGLMGSGTAAALFSNPITAIAGAGLLVGSILLGKAKQRKADERVVDTYWVEYSRVLKELTAGVNTDRIMGDDALSQAAEARSTAVDLIGQIKTKSVRESRLRNQIPQIDAHDLTNLRSAVEAQRTRLANQAKDLDARRNLDSRLVPEFATGGVVPGPFGSRVPAVLHAGEVVLNARQQAAVGYNALADAGVPGLAGDSVGGSQIPNIVIINEIGTESQDRMFINGMTSRNTRKATAQTLSTILKYS